MGKAMEWVDRWSTSVDCRGSRRLLPAVALLLLAVGLHVGEASTPERSEDWKAKIDIRALSSAVELYRLDHGRYPTTEEGLEVLTRASDVGEGAPARTRPYLSATPIDPWGHPYRYASPGVHGDFDIWSEGADAEPGGRGADADVTSWRGNDEHRRGFHLPDWAILMLVFAGWLALWGVVNSPMLALGRLLKAGPEGARVARRAYGYSLLSAAAVFAIALAAAMSSVMLP